MGNDNDKITNTMFVGLLFIFVSDIFPLLSGSWGSVYNTVQRAGLIGSSGLSYEVLIHEAMRMRVTVTANK